VLGDGVVIRDAETKRLVEGEDRQRRVLLPPRADDYATENNPVCVIEAFVNELDVAALGFEGDVAERPLAPRSIRRLSQNALDTH
jgi:hypothetical protein